MASRSDVPPRGQATGAQRGEKSHSKRSVAPWAGQNFLGAPVLVYKGLVEAIEVCEGGIIIIWVTIRPHNSI